MTTERKFTKTIMKDDLMLPVSTFEHFDIDCMSASIRVHELGIRDLLDFEKKYTIPETNKLNIRNGEAIFDLLTHSVRDSDGEKIFNSEEGQKVLECLPSSVAQKMFQVAFRLSWLPETDKKKES